MLNVLLQKHNALLEMVALFGILIVIFDYLHYVSGNLSSKIAVEIMDQPFLVNKRSMYFKLRVVFYRTKQIKSIIGSLLLLVILTITFFIC